MAHAISFGRGHLLSVVLDHIGVMAGPRAMASTLVCRYCSAQVSGAGGHTKPPTPVLRTYKNCATGPQWRYLTIGP